MKIENIHSHNLKYSFTEKTLRNKLLFKIIFKSIEATVDFEL